MPPIGHTPEFCMAQATLCKQYELLLCSLYLQQICNARWHQSAGSSANLHPVYRFASSSLYIVMLRTVWDNAGLSMAVL